MVETIPSTIRAAAPAPSSAPVLRREFLNPDGSAVPDIIAYHHRPEDLGDMSDQTVPDETDSAFFGADGMTFGDLLDIINPLQHIPIVSTIYRALTGDEISPGARIAGGALFGGPIGLGVAIVNAAMEASTGEDIGDTVLAALTGGEQPAATQTAATARPAGTAVAAADSDPALWAAGTMPVSLLPDRVAATQHRPAPARPPIAAGAARAGAGLPFGGMGALPFAAASQTANDPVGAVLRARSAVPMAGRAPLGRVERRSPLPIVDSRLSDKLAALAARTAAQPAAPNRDDGADPAARPAPTTMISQAMLDALDRYRQMKQAEFGARPRG